MRATGCAEALIMRPVEAYPSFGSRPIGGRFPGTAILLTAVENGGAGAVSRRSKMAAHNRAVFWEGRIGAIAPTTPPYRERHRSAQRHGDLERDSA